MVALFLAHLDQHLKKGLPHSTGRLRHAALEWPCETWRGLMTAAFNQLAIPPRLRWSYFQVLQWAQTPVTIHFQSGATCDVHEESTPQKKRAPVFAVLDQGATTWWTKKTSWMNTIRRTQKTSHEWDERKSLERFLKKMSKTFVCCQADLSLSSEIILTTLFDLTTLLSQIGGAHLYWSNRRLASSASTCPARR